MADEHHVHAASPHEGFPACNTDVEPNWLTNNSWSTVLDQVTCPKCLAKIYGHDVESESDINRTEVSE